MNLVPWFPEIAILAGTVALIPALVALRTATRRPELGTFAEPGLIAVVVLVVLDGLISARTGASFALGAIAALSIQWMADFGIESRTLGLSARGTSLLGLGLVFELFGSAAGMDDGGWKLFAQIVAAFALGSSVISACRKSDSMVPEASDTGVFAAAAALVVAAATPFAANRLDGVAYPMLVATTGIFGGAVAVLWKGSAGTGLVTGAAVVGGLVALAATGLDPVALGLHEDALSPQVTLLAGLGGVVLGAGITLINRRMVTIALVVVAVASVHIVGPYGAAVVALAAVTAVALPSAPAQAVTVVAALALVVASHSGSPLVTPSHWSGWFHTFVAAVVVGVIGAAGKGPRFALVRVAVLTWIVIGPFLR